MADLSLGSLIKGEVAPAVSEWGGAFSQQMKEEKETQQKQVDASFEDSRQAIKDEYGKQSWAIEAANGVMRDAMISELAPADDKFVNTDSDTEAFMNAHKLPHRYYGEMRQSKSQMEMNIKANWFSKELELDKSINEAIGSSGRMVATGLNMVASPEMALGVGIGGMLGKSATVAKTAAVEGAGEAYMAAVRYGLDDDYSAEDAFIDAMIGTSVATGATYMVRYPRASVLRKQGDYIHTNKTNIETAQNKMKKTEANEASYPKAREEVDVEMKAHQTKVDDVEKRLVGEEPKHKTRKLQKELDGLKRKDTKKAKALQKKIDDIADETVDTGKQAGKLQKELDKLAKKTDDLKKKSDDVEGLKVDNKTKVMNEQQKIIEESVFEIEENMFEYSKAMGRDATIAMRSEFEQLIKNTPEMKHIDELMLEVIEKPTAWRSIVDNIPTLTSKQKKMMIAAGVIFGASTASASSGDDDGMGIATMALIAITTAALAPSAIKSMANGQAKEMMTNVAQKMKKSEESADIDTSPQGVEVTKGKKFADKLHTGLTSTVAPFIKAGGESKEIITDLLYSAEFGAGAAELKQNWFRASMAKYADAEKKAFKGWRQENGISTTKNIFVDENNIAKFREEVADVIEGKKSDSKSVNQMVKDTVEVRKHAYDVNKEYGTEGFDNMEFKPDMLPRLWKSGGINSMLRGMDEAGVEQVRQALENAMAVAGDKNARKQADQFIKSWQKGYSTVKGADADSIYASMVKGDLLKEGTEFDDVMESLTGYKDISARAKNRIDFDIQDFAKELDGMKIEINGKTTEMKLNMFVDRDIKSIIDKTGNSLYGSASLSSRGYTTIRKLTERINKGITDPELNKQAHQITDLVMGKPADVTNKFMHDVSNMLKDITLAGKLPLVAFSTPTEVIHTLGNMGIIRGTQEMVQGVYNTFGKDSLLAQQLKGVNGLGTSTARLDMSHHGFSDDMLDLTDSDITSKLRNGTMKMRDATILFSGLSSITDILQGANQAMNAEKFAKLVSGMSDGMNRARFKSYGIDDETIDMFTKDMFQFNGKGKLKQLEMSNWSQRQKDKFSEVLFNMNQQYTPETTIGETPLFSRTNDFGRMMTTLTSYSLHQFNTHGLQDMRVMDRNAGLHMLGGVLGTYVGLQGRYAVQDKEIDNNTLLMYSFMNSPQMLGVGAIKSMMNPAVMDTTGDMLNVVGAQ